MKNLLAITLVFILSLFVVEESRGEIPDVMLECVLKENSQWYHIFSLSHHLQKGTINNLTQKEYISIKSDGSAYRRYISHTKPSTAYGLRQPYIDDVSVIEFKYTVRESNDMKKLILEGKDSYSLIIDRKKLTFGHWDRNYYGKPNFDRVKYKYRCKIIDIKENEFEVFFTKRLNHIRKLSYDKRESYEKEVERREEYQENLTKKQNKI